MNICDNKYQNLGHLFYRGNHWYSVLLQKRYWDTFVARLYASLDPKALDGKFEIKRYIRPAAPVQVRLFVDEHIDEEGVLQGSFVVMTSETNDDSASSEYFQHVLSWQSAILP